MRLPEESAAIRRLTPSTRLSCQIVCEPNISQAISNVTPLSPEHGGGVCATYRCDDGTTKLKIKARTTEGDYGDIRLTVVAKTPPKKSAQVCARFRV